MSNAKPDPTIQVATIAAQFIEARRTLNAAEKALRDEISAIGIEAYLRIVVAQRQLRTALDEAMPASVGASTMLRGSRAKSRLLIQALREIAAGDPADPAAIQEFAQSVLRDLDLLG